MEGAGAGAQALQSTGQAGRLGAGYQGGQVGRVELAREDERPRPGRHWGGGWQGENEEGLPASQRGTRGHISHPEAVTLTSPCLARAWCLKNTSSLLSRGIRILLKLNALNRAEDIFWGLCLNQNHSPSNGNCTLPTPTSYKVGMVGTMWSHFSGHSQ